MTGLIKKIFFILLNFSPSLLFAFPDSVQVKVPTILNYTTKEVEITGNLKYYRTDSLLDDLQIVNPAIRYFYNDLGNIGSASDPKLFGLSRSVLTEFGNHAFELYKWKPSGIRFYKANKRYTNLDYHLSGGKEQQISITLAQNIFPNWNAGIDFNRQGSLGFLNNGRTFITNFNFFTWYHLPNQRYHLFASATWNSIKNEVNGGLTSDSLYDANSFSNTDLAGLKVSLNDDEQFIRNHIFSLMHYYDFVSKKDSVGKHLSSLRILHHSEFERSSYNYEENAVDTDYYKNQYYGPELKDSMHFDNWVHKLSLQAFHSFANFKPVHRAAVEITAGNQWFNHKQLYDTTLENYFAEARIRTAGINNKCRLDVSERFVVDGVNKNDHLFRLTFTFPLIWGASMDIGLQNAKQSPALFHNFYQSDHFIWQNNFDKISSQEYFFSIHLDKYNFSITGQSMNIGRYIYFDTLAYPVQSMDSIRVNRLQIKKNFRFRNFVFNNTVWIQETNNDALRIPSLLSHHSLFYEKMFFKKRLAAQFGFDVHYTSSYFSNAFSPAAAVFHTQNVEKTNGYPLIDFFVNFRIKSARLFLKLQNIGDNIVKDNYFNTLYYPMPGMVIQFGVNWRFFD